MSAGRLEVSCTDFFPGACAKRRESHVALEGALLIQASLERNFLCNCSGVMRIQEVAPAVFVPTWRTCFCQPGGFCRAAQIYEVIRFEDELEAEKCSGGLRSDFGIGGGRAARDACATE
jgi:hypothetical protein